MKIILNIEYSCIHGTYWMFYGVVCSFASVFLLDRGYSNSDIGIILAVANVLAVFMQPILADLADRSKRISLIGVTEVITIILAVLMAATFILNRASIALSVVFVMMVAWITALQPLFNSLCFKLSECGHEVSFGIPRSMGSLFYAVLVAFLGTLVEKHGIIVLQLSGEMILAALLFTLWLTSRHFNKAGGSKVAEAKGETLEEEINLIDFVKRNRLFVIANIAIAGIFFSNAIFNNYMLQIVESVGGDSEDMGHIFSVMAFLEIPPMFLFDKIRKHFRIQTLLKFSAVCFAVKTAWVFFSGSVGMLIVAQFFQLTAFGVFIPAIVIFIDEIMDRGEAVKGQALYTIVVTVSTVFASLAGGFILDIAGPKIMVLVALVITGLGTVVFAGIIDKIKNKIIITS